MRSRLGRTITAIAASVALLLFSAPPTDAHNLTLMWGTGHYDVLGVSHVNRGNIVGLWQAFLFSYNQVPCSKFDRVFGSATAQGTRNLQGFWGLTADGVVGQNTWTEAGSWLEMYGDDGFLTTYWNPAFYQRPWPDGLGRFFYVYGADWKWESTGEGGSTESSSMPQFQDHSSGHPTITSCLRRGLGEG